MMKENHMEQSDADREREAGALGRGFTALLKGKTVIMVQFLRAPWKQKAWRCGKRLEPEFKLFRFENRVSFFDQLSEEEKDEAGYPQWPEFCKKFSYYRRV